MAVDEIKFKINIPKWLMYAVVILLSVGLKKLASKLVLKHLKINRC